MPEEIQLIDPCTSIAWMEFVNNHPNASIFHHPAWMKLMSEVYAYRMFAVCLMDGAKILAGIPFADVHSFITGNRWVSIPFSDNCQPLLASEGLVAADALIAFLKSKISHPVPKIEIRWDVDTSIDVFRETNFVYSVRAVAADKNELYKSFNKKNTQRSIEIASEAGIVVKECKSFKDFEAFHHLQVKTRRRLGVPAQPKSFFRGVWKNMIESGLGFSLVAYKDSTPVAGGVFFKFNKTIFFKYSASDMTYKALAPSHACIWAAFQRAIDEGCTTFDFGRTDRNNDGLRRFKKNWGATEQELTYTVIAEQPPKHALSKFDNVVSGLVRHSPEFVCTFSGRLLYKHFA